MQLERSMVACLVQAGDLVRGVGEVVFSSLVEYGEDEDIVLLDFSNGFDVVTREYRMYETLEIVELV